MVLWNKKVKKGKKGSFSQESQEKAAGEEVKRNHSAKNDGETDKENFGEKIRKKYHEPQVERTNLPADCIASLRYQFSLPQKLFIFRKASEDVYTESHNGQRRSQPQQLNKWITEYTSENSYWWQFLSCRPWVAENLALSFPCFVLLFPWKFYFLFEHHKCVCLHPTHILRVSGHLTLLMVKAAWGLVD